MTFYMAGVKTFSLPAAEPVQEFILPYPHSVLGVPECVL